MIPRRVISAVYLGRGLNPSKVQSAADDIREHLSEDVRHSMAGAAAFGSGSEGNATIKANWDPGILVKFCTCFYASPERPTLEDIDMPCMLETVANDLFPVRTLDKLT